MSKFYGLIDENGQVMVNKGNFTVLTTATRLLLTLKLSLLTLLLSSNQICAKHSCLLLLGFLEKTTVLITNVQQLSYPMRQMVIKTTLGFQFVTATIRGWDLVSIFTYPNWQEVIDTGLISLFQPDCQSG